MPFGLSAGAIAAIGAGVSAVGTVAAGYMTAQGAKDAAKTAAAQNQRGIDAQTAQYNQTRDDLQPYNDAGVANLPDYQDFWKNAQAETNAAWDRAQAAIPKPMTEEELVKTPGYQFNLSQGLKAAQNSAAARGLGISGSAMKAASNWATGLADSTYQNQFANQQTLYGDAFNQFTGKANALGQTFKQLADTVNTGENAASRTGTAGTAAANAISGLDQNTGAIMAAGITGQARGLASGITGLADAPTNFLAISKALNDGDSSGSSSGKVGPIDNGEWNQGSSSAWD